MMQDTRKGHDEMSGDNDMQGGKGMGGMGMMGGKGPMMGGKGPVMGGKGDPLMMMGPPPRFDAIMEHLEQAGRLADFVDQVEETCHKAHHGQPQPTLHHLELKEAGITSGIEKLLSQVKQGKLFSENKIPVHAGDSPRTELRAELT